MIQPTRRTQPYRRGIRPQGSTLDAMLKGAPASLPNPARVHQDLLAQQESQLGRLLRLLGQRR